MRSKRRGFVLIVVLWVIIGVSALGVGISLIARRAAGEARNRIALRAATWRAQDCVSRAQAAIAAALDRQGFVASDSARWDLLAQSLAASSFIHTRDCSVELRAAGQLLNVNTADSAMLSRLMRALDIGKVESDSIVDAILDWRDADDQPRALGAEREWYTAAHRALPRNGPFADAREVQLVRGVDAVPGLDTLFDTERSRVSLNDAPVPVIAALPGFTREAIALVAEHRTRHSPITDFLSFAAELSPGARDTLQSHYGDLVQLATTMPDAWILTSRGTAGAPRITDVIELRLVLAGERAAVVRRRTWIE